MVFLSPDEAALATTLLVFLFGASTLPLNYVYSFLFSNHSTAQITIMVRHFPQTNIMDKLFVASIFVRILPLAFSLQSQPDPTQPNPNCDQGFNFVTGFCCVIGYFIMSSIPDTKELASQLVHIFRFFPPYNLGEVKLTSSPPPPPASPSPTVTSLPPPPQLPLPSHRPRPQSTRICLILTHTLTCAFVPSS